jgi:hypothetical protein
LGGEISSAEAHANGGASFGVALFPRSFRFFHFLVGFVGAQAEETLLLLQKQMLTKEHLSVLGCRFVAFNYPLFVHEMKGKASSI